MPFKNLTIRKQSLAIMIASFLPAMANSAVEYTVTDLGALPGGRYSQGLGINDQGDVATLALTSDNLFFSAVLSQLNQLPSPLTLMLGGNYSQANDINNFHQITGLGYLFSDNNYHAFIWDALTGAKDLGTLELVSTSGNSIGLSINDNNQIAGMSTVNSARAQHAAVWSKNKTGWTIEDLLTLTTDGSGDSQANDINNLGAAAGYSSINAAKAHRAVVWNKNLGKWIAREIGTLQGSFSEASAINDNGLVAGSSSTSLDAQIHAFVSDTTQSPMVLTDLKTLGGTYSEAHDINNNGEVVGYSTGPGDLTQAAFVWRNSATGLQDLNNLIERPAAPAVGWTLLEASSINNNGDITGIGFLGAYSGEKHAFLLTKLITDTTPPIISFTITPSAPAASGWYLTTPSLVWSVTDSESAITAKVGCSTISVANTDSAGILLSCSATSSGGTRAPVSTPPIRIDSTLPVLSGVPVSFTQAAANQAGAVVTYTLPTAVDTFSGISPAGVVCAPASGSTMPIGATKVNCSLADNAGNAVNGSFVVTVADQTPPVFSGTPASVTLAATSAAGLVVAYTPPTASDLISGVNAAGVTCLPASGSTFALGATTVNCSVADNAGNTANSSFVVTVADQTPPSFTTCPATVALNQGQALPVLNATDNVTASPLVSNNAPATLPVGTTTVTWKATDQAGLSATCMQQVTVSAAISESIAITRSQCKRTSAASGEWLVQGTTSIPVSNSIQLYSTASVPANLTSNKLGLVTPDAKGQWQYLAKPGPACTAPISLRSSATGKALNNVAVTVQ